MVKDSLLGLQEISGARNWEERSGALWMSAPEMDVTAMAQHMADLDARLMTMTGKTAEGGETLVIYHYMLNNQILNICVKTRNNSLTSITGITRAASWIEREIQDLYAVQFEGHPAPERLVRPAQLEPGFFRQPGGHNSKLSDD